MSKRIRIELSPQTLKRVLQLAAQTRYGEAHVRRWQSVLVAAGETIPGVKAITAAEAKANCRRYSSKLWPEIAALLEAAEAGAAAPPRPDDTPLPPISPIANEIVERINAIRASGFHCVDHRIPADKHHLIPVQPPTHPVEVDDILTAAANLTLDDWEAHPAVWGKHNTRHVSHDGTLPHGRLRRAEEAHFEHWPSKRWDGYAENFTSFKAASEDVAERAVKNWCDSFGHCLTLVDGGIIDADRIGVAVRQRPTDPTKWAACAWFAEFNRFWEDHPDFFTW